VGFIRVAPGSSLRARIENCQSFVRKKPDLEKCAFPKCFENAKKGSSINYLSLFINSINLTIQPKQA